MHPCITSASLCFLSLAWPEVASFSGAIEIDQCLRDKRFLFQTSSPEATKAVLDKALYKQMQKLAQKKKDAARERVIKKITTGNI